MKNYSTYTLEDFAGDEEFRDWIQGQSSQDQFWQTFLIQHPDKKEVMQQAEWIIRSTHMRGELISEREIKAEVQKFMRKAIEFSTEEAIERRKAWTLNNWISRHTRALAVAAIALFAIGLIWHHTTAPTVHKTLRVTKQNNMVETRNDSDSALRLVLSDKSIVILSPKSKLQYPSEFEGNERKVYLTGEAGFSVTSTSNPFIVHSGDMVTKVLGTRFVIRAFEEDEKSSVQVQSGKVSVYSNQSSTSNSFKERRGVILTVNQAAIFEKNAKQITKTLVSSPVVITKDNKVVNYFYDEVPLPEILDELEKGYGIAIQYNQTSFERCKITATLSNETLFEKLELLCKIVSASYEIVDGQISINGAGCN